MTIRCLLVALSLVGFSVVVMGGFGSDPQPDGSLNVEERGVPGNCAFLVRYADLVVVAKRVNFATGGSVLKVEEVIWERKGMEVGQEVYVSTRPIDYSDNRQTISPRDKALDSGQFSYHGPTFYNEVPVMIFLRVAEVSDEVREHWELGDLKVFKAVDGREGVVPLPHHLEDGGEGVKDKFWRRFGKSRMKIAGKVFGVSDMAMIEKFVRAIYAGDGERFAKLRNGVVEEFRRDSGALVRMLALEEE